MELILQKVCGRSAQLPIRLRRCGPADAAAFFALQNEVRAAMPHRSSLCRTHWKTSRPT